MNLNPFLLLGVMLGTALRTLAPFLMSGSKWDWKYLSSACIGALVALVGGTLVLPAIDPSSPPLNALLLGFFAAISLQTGARQVEKAAGISTAVKVTRSK
jgi:hypothetical protein